MDLTRVNSTLTRQTPQTWYNEAGKEIDTIRQIHKGGFSMKRLAHLILVTASPFQHFIDNPCHTHSFCNRQALRILKNAHAQECFEFFKRYGKDFDIGTHWADKDWKNVEIGRAHV